MNDILDYFMIPDVIYEVKISSYPLKKLKCQNSDITIGFPSQKTQLYALWDQQSHFIEISGVLGDSGTILGRFGGPWRHKRGRNFSIFYFWLYHRFSSPKTLPMLIFRSKQSFYRAFWHFSWFSGHFGSFWGSMTSQKGSRF